MLRFVAAALVAAILLAAPALAGPRVKPGDCTDRQEAIELVTTLYPPATIWRELTGEDTQHFLEPFNAEPPPSQVEADDIILFEKQGSPKVLGVMLKDGCRLDAMWWLKRELVESWIGLLS